MLAPEIDIYKCSQAFVTWATSLIFERNPPGHIWHCYNNSYQQWIFHKALSSPLEDASISINLSSSSECSFPSPPAWPLVKQIQYADRYEEEPFGALIVAIIWVAILCVTANWWSREDKDHPAKKMLYFCPVSYSALVEHDSSQRVIKTNHRRRCLQKITNGISRKALQGPSLSSATRQDFMDIWTWRIRTTNSLANLSRHYFYLTRSLGSEGASKGYKPWESSSPARIQ